MGNCACSRVKEENESYYGDYFDDISLGDIMGSPPHHHQPTDLISELDDDDDDYYDDDDDDDDGGGSDILRDISFESDSNISKLDNIFIEDELCGICAFNFDEDKHLPRIIPCGHTFCYYCIRKMARRYKYKFLKCPLDRKRHILKQRHTDHILVGEHSLSTVSIASGSTDLGIELVLDLDLFHQPVVDSEDDTEVRFGEINTDTSSYEESEGHSFNLPLPHNYNTTESNSQIPDNLIIKARDMTLECVELEDTDSDKNESDTGTLQDNQQQSPMSHRKFRCEVNNGDVLDIIYLRRKRWLENKTDLSNTEQDDMYADERSVRSYEWVEPDYD